MTIWLFLSGIIGPALFWTGYFYYKDRFRPEPIIIASLVYLSGVAAALLCSKLYTFLAVLNIPTDPSILMENYRPLFLAYLIGVVGLLEELCKFIPFLLVLKIVKEFDDPVDCFFYSAVIAIGFASYENLIYLTRLTGLELFGRALASPLTHTIFSAIWGYTVGMAKLKQKSLMRAAVIGIILAAVIHGLFDFLTLSTEIRLLSAVLILVVWLWRIVVVERINKQEYKNSIPE